MIRWYKSRPKSNFEDEGAEKTVSLLSSLSSFGMLLQKADYELSLYIGSAKTESHHIVSMPGITSVLHERIQDIPPQKITSMRLKNSYVHPLCTSVKECKLYEQSSILSDFTFGVVGRQINPRVVRDSAKSFLKKTAKKAGSALQSEITRPVQLKLEESAFFATSIFFACEAQSAESLLSSINFTNRLSEPNALIPKRRQDAKTALNLQQRLPYFDKKVPVLSITEIASILPLPPGMFGLEMPLGADKTFSNLHDVATEDPVKFFTDMWQDGR